MTELAIVASKPPLWLRTLRLMCFVLPLAYVALILGVVAHEVLGHGLAAVAVGGTFSGFVIRWDGMGWASAYAAEGAPPIHTVVILSAGIVVTTAIALGLLLIGRLYPKRVHLRLALLVFAYIFFMDGLPYLFWNAWRPTPPGDVGRILAILAMKWSGVAWLRLLILGIGGIALLAVTIHFCLRFLQSVEQIVNDGERLVGMRRAAVILLLFGLSSSAWFMFDWNQLIHGIGQLPSIVGAGVMIATATVLYRYSLKPVPLRPNPTTTWRNIVTAWAAVAVTMALIWCAN